MAETIVVIERGVYWTAYFEKALITFAHLPRRIRTYDDGNNYGNLAGI